MTKRQVINRQAKVKAELAKGIYSGWMGTAEFLSYDWKTFHNWCCGEVIIGIGANDYRAVMHNCLNYAMGWGEYQKAKRALEHKYGLDKLPS